ncbi:heavy-metal-associated domain-containing protein [Nocardioides koreensis]|uniref:Heavy-metal-associated domain-containing protein n=1 Tax=Nocardioides koreensis TaxID=433651 RepID=A0ABP5L0R2_9ACTN
MSTTSTWTVAGMTCGHCVASVSEEITELDGVEHVDVVLETGAVTVTSTAPLDPASVRIAVEEAGYALT